jgi:hypothetical protein
LFVVAAIACASCNDHREGSYTNRLSVVTAPDSASAPFGVRLSPDRLAVTPFVQPSCSFGRGFETTFDVIATGGSGMNLDRVTLEMMDGTHLGSALTFPSPVLNTMFGSTVLIGTRAFRFNPHFDCLAVAPQSLLIDLLFRERFGRTHTMTLHAKF